MIINNNKKGAVEMSLNLIIMLIIGLTILGLIIAFVTNFLGNAEENFTGQLSEDDKTKIEQVKRESGNFAFLESSTRLVQGANDPGKLYLKIRNPTGEDFAFDGGLFPESGDLSVEITEGNIGEGAYGGGISVYGPPITLTSAQSDGYPVEVYADESVPLGTYYAKFSLTLPGGSESYNQVVTITVE